MDSIVLQCSLCQARSQTIRKGGVEFAAGGGREPLSCKEA